MVKGIKNLKYYQAIGRRKEAVARVRLYLVGSNKTASIKNPMTGSSLKISQGEIYVNGKLISQLFPRQIDKARYLVPLKITNNEDRFAISILVQGGGKNGQLEAIIHGLARAIEKVDHDQYRPTLKKHGLLTRDPRVRERRKVGMGGKARRKKQSPKR
ncbi:30S ribosomal protein S9 [Candidatus Roizmanbacteria bacterium CG02_land_8_20_14_3_00_36_15]|uniref:30S ribosomal protein S9 n=2 Tax=Candidatus Roizmaniibacteriota TaxID=1752723 RepID=A0A2M8KLV7_9BACT|nr:MAG: 30S ribosomal protein S9 [Candidatus Roizmanbacteria bacterium CG03_land_8_20_14_0_80_36_21]PIV37868.1 MAG: 30S ribosomal protein S9 [Candidatus Roizmanbacteria bacterium CG02_land_8_20_14_3_00_36_15]PIY70173.1 MAG: 30S ribosomal protein S9 [Candidatus Roizmanbacteria bacterium CG_4_10_14_0_8_um_filter_36_36]PJA53651.1 MAG: 30S ribosomal protein S9 [Candidatus Roizmanbacteria bacterium CG_4_9_14_3_um_filter_36_11]PJC81676.1 MAG: 30S ribosomal protein S9 [Candidatus Roizmanbacteria bacte